MRIKTAYLTGPALDWAVASSDGRPRGVRTFQAGYFDYHMYHYSTDWAQGGPIIEGEHLQSHWAGPVLGYAAMHPDCKKYSYGPTMLIAAMRCFVTSKLGDEIEIPEELT